jgi:hypothetical protein
LNRPPGSVCVEYNDGYIWLVWDTITGFDINENIQIAQGVCADYHHILGTNCIRLDGTDTDGDLISNGCDNCPDDANADQADIDGDGVGDVCDNCPDDFNEDQADSDIDDNENPNPDGIGDVCDNCRNDFNPDQADSDVDGIGDVCDNCPDDFNPDQADSDVDGIGDVCDNCPNDFNRDQADSDVDDDGNPNPDGIGDDCDSCPTKYNPGDDQSRDADNDGVPDACDNCPPLPNGEDIGTCTAGDDIMLGKPCESDGDCGSVPLLGQCSLGQEDSNEDGQGDACEEFFEMTQTLQDGVFTKPGEPLYDEVCVKNEGPDPITIQRPDEFNIITEWIGPNGNRVPPTDRHGGSVGPEDFITLQPGEEYCVRIDISKTVHPRKLVAGAHQVKHVFVDWWEDPELINGECTDQTVEDDGSITSTCYEKWIGWIDTGDPITVNIEAKPVETFPFNGSATRNTLCTGWTASNAPDVQVVVTDFEQQPDVSPADVDLSSIRLQGLASPNSSNVGVDRLNATFGGFSVLQAAGSVNAGQRKFLDETFQINQGTNSGDYGRAPVAFDVVEPGRGDFNSDCCVDLADLFINQAHVIAVMRNQTSPDPAHDLNSDGNVNIADVRYMIQHLCDNARCAPCF